jgi:hypothetical protein
MIIYKKPSDDEDIYKRCLSPTGPLRLAENSP